MLPYLDTSNRMPVRTWRHLGVNEAASALTGADRVLNLESLAGKRDESLVVPPYLEEISGFLISRATQKFVDRFATRRLNLCLPASRLGEDPVVVKFDLDENAPALVDDIFIEAEEGSRATVIVEYASKYVEAACHYGRTNILAHRGADLTVVKVQMLGDKASHFDAIGGFVEEDARLSVITCELGSQNLTSSCNLVLHGDRSAASLDTLYLGHGTRSLDMSYRIEQRGKKTCGNIRAKGVLTGRSKKIFRDTLDFVSGASGSRGREEESVLMLSPYVGNISAPLLLCGEDDVEGEHACSSGKPDDKAMFYLMTRGIDETDAKRMLAEAAFSSVVEKIPDAFVREEIMGTLHQVIRREGRAN